MRISVPLVALVAIASSLLAGNARAQTVPCEELRSKVEARIRGNGVTGFTVQVVEAGAAAKGQVVGTCEHGTKKLVYLKAEGAASLPSQARPASGAAAAVKPKQAAVITECADGRTITTGSCKQ